MSAEIDGHYLEALKKYYAASGDKNSKIVDFSSHELSPFLQESEHIAEGTEDFSIIDPFSGTRPVVLNYRVLVEGGEVIPFIPGIILDSHIVSYLHQYVTDRTGDFRNTLRGCATRKLITTLAVKGWDFNALFYLLESVSKVDFDKVFPFAEAFGRSILLQLMDDNLFIKTGRIETDPNKYKEYTERHGAVPFEAASADRVRFISSSGIVSQARLHIQAIYATLLKITLLNSQRIPCVQKILLLFEFYQEQIGVFLSMEAIIACLHFVGKTGKFLSLKRDSLKTKTKILASAWDLFLLRMPESIIANEGNDYTSVYYVCTAEKALQKLGEMYVVRRVSSLREGTGTIPSLVGFRTDILSQEVGQALTIEFGNMCNQMLKISSSREPANLERVLSIVSELEQQVSELSPT